MSQPQEFMELLSQSAKRLDVNLRGGDTRYARVITDTRQLQRGDLFVALVGERYDAHDFIRRAASLGAAGAIVSRHIDCELPQIVVPDTLLALQALARSWRQDFVLPVIGVTGSNGKTTTKQLLAAVFAQRGEVLYTEGNLNNHIGVPLTLLRLRHSHRTAVIEMGANHAGEIALLASIAQPSVGIVTQAGDAHLEGFGSREGVAKGKGELFAALGESDTAVINADDAYAGLWRQLAQPAETLRFGLAEHAEVHATQLQSIETAGRSAMAFMLNTPGGQASVMLPLAGRHNVMNALAAAACGVALGLSADDIAAGLALAQGASGRVVWSAAERGARLIDDSYNANPSSLKAGLELLAEQGGRRWAVLGGMAELGPAAAELHEDAGRIAHKLEIDRLYALGPMAPHYAQGFGNKTQTFDDVDALIAALRKDLGAEVTLLVKGSRSARMERVVEALLLNKNNETGSHH